MKYLFILSLAALLLFVNHPVYAQTGATPTFFCVGTNPRPPCATIPPSQAISGTVPITPGTTNPTTQTSQIPSSPTPTSPCVTITTTGTVHAFKAHKHTNGAISNFFQLLIKLLLQILQQLFGGGNITLPVISPPPTPVQSQPTQGLQPTEGVQPTQGVIPSNSPTQSMPPCPTNTAIPTPTPTTAPNIPTITPVPTTVRPTPTPGTLTNLPAQSAAVVYYGNDTRAATYEHPGAMVVAGRGNYQDQTFKDISAAGGTVLMYLDTLINNTSGNSYDAMLIKSSACGAAVPLWPGNLVANSSGSLNDFRVGGIEQGKLKCVLEKMVADNPHMGGFFADDLGSRSWYPGFSWDTWGSQNQQDYRNGAIALLQTFRQVADEHHLIVLVNGSWGAGTLAAAGGGYPDLNQPGASLADGGVVEHHTSSELAYWKAYACSKQWASASPVTHGIAFNYAIESSASDVTAYANTNCFAFVNNQTDYSYAPPIGPFHYTGLPSKVTQ